MAFYRGQKVVCIDASGEPGKTWLADIPEEGQVYTVFMVFISQGELQLVLDEIKNDAVFDHGYRAKRFRPVVERKTDISVFTAMLNPSKKTERV